MKSTYPLKFYVKVRDVSYLFQLPIQQLLLVLLPLHNLQLLDEYGGEGLLVHGLALAGVDALRPRYQDLVHVRFLIQGGVLPRFSRLEHRLPTRGSAQGPAIAA